MARGQPAQWGAPSQLAWPPRDRQQGPRPPLQALKGSRQSPPGDFALGQMGYSVVSVRPDGLVGPRGWDTSWESSPGRQHCLTPSCPSQRSQCPPGNFITAGHSGLLSSPLGGEGPPWHLYGQKGAWEAVGERKPQAGWERRRCHCLALRAAQDRQESANPGNQQAGALIPGQGALWAHTGLAVLLPGHLSASGTTRPRGHQPPLSSPCPNHRNSIAA